MKGEVDKDRRAVHTQTSRVLDGLRPCKPWNVTEPLRSATMSTVDADLTDTYDYDLPDELVAARPSAIRRDSRLMKIDRSDATIEHRQFHELPEFLREGDLIVLNDARVIPARVAARKETGGAVEVFVVELTSGEWHTASPEISFRVMTRSSKPVRAESVLSVDGFDDAFVVERWEHGEGTVTWTGEATTPAELLDRIGEIPLPPYILKRREELGEVVVDDAQRYQTVFARNLGAVAAPTAGLHFDESIFDRLEERGVRRAHITLEVGPGTFRPVTSERLSDHEMHSERYIVPDGLGELIDSTKATGGRVIAVGTTSMRTLEAEAVRATPFEPGVRRTDIFLHPSNPPRFCDGLLTNFHLPRSTLLALVAGFAGVDLMRRAYNVAVEERYRFYSYGDAMLILNGADA